MRITYLFPGQGAQYVGMGRDLYKCCYSARSVFDEAEKILPDVGINRLCFEGPLEKLTETRNSQVCILVVSIAILHALYANNERRLSAEALAKAETTNDEIVACAGLSLGELTALVASGAVIFPDAVRIVRKRGELMEDASRKNPGSMASILGLSQQDVERVCSESGAEVANLNCPGQIVISGTKAAIERSMKLAKEKGAKKVIPLNVAGPFHSSLMKEASELFRIELDKWEFSAPKIGVVSNVTADYVKTPEEIKENLVKQLCSPVRWEESIRRIASQGAAHFYEIGPGKVLKGLLCRIDANLKVRNIEKMEDIIKLLNC